MPGKKLQRHIDWKKMQKTAFFILLLATMIFPVAAATRSSLTSVPNTIDAFFPDISSIASARRAYPAAGKMPHTTAAPTTQEQMMLRPGPASPISRYLPESLCKLRKLQEIFSPTLLIIRDNTLSDAAAFRLKTRFCVASSFIPLPSPIRAGPWCSMGMSVIRPDNFKNI